MERGGLYNEARTVLSRVFEEHQNELYWLAFLVTGDADQSAEAFTRALDFEDGGNSTFRGFMIAWARKLVIAEAAAGIGSELRESALRLRMGDVTESNALPSPGWIGSQNITRRELEQALLALDVLPRCAVV